MEVTAVGFEPTPLRTGALSQRLRPLGQTVLQGDMHYNYMRHAVFKDFCDMALQKRRQSTLQALAGWGPRRGRGRTLAMHVAHID